MHSEAKWKTHRLGLVIKGENDLLQLQGVEVAPSVLPVVLRH